MKTSVILPGKTLGILGGGQLGRMFTNAAQVMGYQVAVLDPDTHSPAGKVADIFIQAEYTDSTALNQLANQCDVITTEFENIPAETLHQLAEKALVYPNAKAVETAQNRIREKQFIVNAGLKTAQYSAIESHKDLEVAVNNVSFPAILKSSQFGYDGKGQVNLNQPVELEAAFDSLDNVPCVLETRIPLLRELSVILGRNANGESQCFPIAENEHRNGILHQTNVPAQCSDEVADIAYQGAMQLAEHLDFVGVMAVEFFETPDHEILVNEIAPRTHNSGHYTQDACLTSQFQQQVRMICGLAHGDSRLLSPVAMINLLGDLWQKGDPDWENILNTNNCKLHLYGKQEARPGRKMGHYNLLDPDQAHLYDKAEAVFQSLLS